MPNDVEKLVTMSTFLGMCYPKVNELNVAFTWRIPPIVKPSKMVIKILASKEPKFSKNKNPIATEKHIIKTFFNFKSMFIVKRNLFVSVCYTPHLRQVALSYMFILPTKYDPKIEDMSKSIVM